MATDQPVGRVRLLGRGVVLEHITLGWNAVGIVVLAVAAVLARSVALAGFGLDSLIEIARARSCSGSYRRSATGVANAKRYA